MPSANKVSGCYEGGLSRPVDELEHIGPDSILADDSCSGVRMRFPGHLVSIGFSVLGNNVLLTTFFGPRTPGAQNMMRCAANSPEKQSRRGRIPSIGRDVHSESVLVPRSCVP